jgi:hypothetical protein
MVMQRIYLTKVVDDGEDLCLGPVIKAQNMTEAKEVALDNELVIIGEVPELQYRPRNISIH